MKKSDWLTALTAALVAIFLVPVSAVAAPDRVDVCHHTSDRVPDQHEWRHLRVHAKALEAHLSHGDGQPGGPVPGSDGALEFDETCNPVPTNDEPKENPPSSDPPSEPDSSEMIFAIAYTDVDPDDGAYDPSSDILIAKLVDGPGDAADGVAGVGDLIIPGQYPEDFDAGGFGSFGVAKHTVTAVGSVTADYVCSVSSDGSDFVWSSGNGDFDQYAEWNPGSMTNLYDDRSKGTAETDQIATASTSPSQPSGDMVLNGADLSDQVFIDVEANCP